MFEPSIFPSEGITNVISSPASAVGPLALDLAGWPQQSRSLDRLLSLSRPFSGRWTRAVASPTDVICGPSGSRLIGSMALARSLANRLKAPAGRAWLDLVFTDLEGIGYACGAVVFPAAGVGAPHIRHRTYWVAQLDNTASSRRGGPLAGAESQARNETRLRMSGAGSGLGNFWRDSDWIYCRDNKRRPIEPGTFPLAHGAAARVGRLRAYGNAICVLKRLRIHKSVHGNIKKIPRRKCQ